MNKRLMAAIMAAGLICSLTACDFLNRAKPTEITTVEETTTEETTTVEETTTTEETTTEETTTSEETTTTEESTSETTTAASTAAKKPTKKPTKAPTKPKSAPKGYKKLYWGNKYEGHKVYIAVKYAKGKVYYQGWWKGKWYKLNYDAGYDYELWEMSGKNGPSGDYFYVQGEPETD